MALRPLYSLTHCDAVAAHVAARYEVGEVSGCSLLNRGFNDSYEVHTDTDHRFVLRIANRAGRGAPNLAYEAAFLHHLDRSGVSVAVPVPDRDGQFWHMATLAEGERPAMLFGYLPGHMARRDSATDARAQGRTLAEVHRAGETYAGPPSRFQLDARHLLHRPLAAVVAHRRSTRTQARSCRRSQRGWTAR